MCRKKIPDRFRPFQHVNTKEIWQHHLQKKIPDRFRPFPTVSTCEHQRNLATSFAEKKSPTVSDRFRPFQHVNTKEILQHHLQEKKNPRPFPTVSTCEHQRNLATSCAGKTSPTVSDRFRPFQHVNTKEIWQHHVQEKKSPTVSDRFNMWTPKKSGNNMCRKKIPDRFRPFPTVSTCEHQRNLATSCAGKKIPDRFRPFQHVNTKEIWQHHLQKKIPDRFRPFQHVNTKEILQHHLQKKNPRLFPTVSDRFNMWTPKKSGNIMCRKKIPDRFRPFQHVNTKEIWQHHAQEKKIPDRFRPFPTVSTCEHQRKVATTFAGTKKSPTISDRFNTWEQNMMAHYLQWNVNSCLQKASLTLTYGDAKFNHGGPLWHKTNTMFSCGRFSIPKLWLILQSTSTQSNQSQSPGHVVACKKQDCV